MMFKKYRIRKLKEYIAALEAEVKVLKTVVYNVESTNLFVVNKLIRAVKQLAIFEIRLEGLQ